MQVWRITQQLENVSLFGVPFSEKHPNLLERIFWGVFCSSHECSPFWLAEVNCFWWCKISNVLKYKLTIPIKLYLHVFWNGMFLGCFQTCRSFVLFQNGNLSCYNASFSYLLFSQDNVSKCSKICSVFKKFSICQDTVLAMHLFWTRAMTF